MALRRFDIAAGGDHFSFKPETEPTIQFWLDKYPEERKRSAVIPLLWLAQKDNKGWLSEPAMRDVADRLEMPYIRVYEVATFYTMFRLQPVGTYHLQVCGTTPCMLRGANDLKDACRSKIGEPFQVSDDGRLSWEEVECLGACVNAPMIQINDYYHEDLTVEALEDIIGHLELDDIEKVPPGTYIDRLNSAPEGEPTSLKDAGLFDGSRNAISSLPNLPGDVEEEPEAAPVAESAEKTNLISDGKKAELVDAEPEGAKPLTFDAPPFDFDDLKRIKGVGPVNEAMLNKLGFYTFKQIAEWTPQNIVWVESTLAFPGRIAREDWVSQASVLMTGAETEFSKRVDAGEVESSKSDEDEA